MNDALYIAATGMQAQQTTIDTIANNLVNVSTPGYKKNRVNFQELMHLGAVNGVDSATGTTSGQSPLGVGIGINSIARDFAAGTLAQTNAPLDVAINGTGFLEVTLADGSIGFTRGGTLQVTKDSYLANASGNVLKPAIHIPANASSIVIGVDGKVMVSTASQAGSAAVEVGQLEMARFSNPSGLKSAAGGVYIPSEASGQPVFGKPGATGMGTIAQGALENSNVSLVDEMVTLMVAQRAYELGSKVAQASDEMMSLTNNLRR
jgi:flagellar basal-body rod protein FlgG